MYNHLEQHVIPTDYKNFITLEIMVKEKFVRKLVQSTKHFDGASVVPNSHWVHVETTAQALSF